MIDFPTAPEWVQDAFARADDLARDSNAFWLEQLGDPGLFGGFQVIPVGDDREERFESMLYGGRTLTGTAQEITAGSRAFVLSRRRGRNKGAA